MSEFTAQHVDIAEKCFAEDMEKSPMDFPITFETYIKGFKRGLEFREEDRVMSVCLGCGNYDNSRGYNDGMCDIMGGYVKGMTITHCHDYIPMTNDTKEDSGLCHVCKNKNERSLAENPAQPVAVCSHYIPVGNNQKETSK